MRIDIKGAALPANVMKAGGRNVRAAADAATAEAAAAVGGRRMAIGRGTADKVGLCAIGCFRCQFARTSLLYLEQTRFWTRQAKQTVREATTPCSA